MMTSLSYSSRGYVCGTIFVALQLSLFLLQSVNVVVLVDAGAVLGKKRAEKGNEQGRSILFDNKSGRKCDLYWVNTFTKPEEFVPQFIEDGVSVGISYGAEKSISSYIGHEFELRELPSKATKACVFDKCRKARIKVSDRFEQKATLQRDFTITIMDDHQQSYEKADDMFTRCEKKINERKLSPAEHIDAVAKCMEDEMNTKLMTDQEERSFQAKIHRDMASDLITLTCGNVNETQSREIQNITWHDSDEKKNYRIRKMHELPTSTILIVDDFVTQDYCDALKKHRKDDGNDSTNDGDKVIPLSASFERTNTGRKLKSLLNKMYNLVMDEMDWDDITVNSNILFKYLEDQIGFDIPKHLCAGSEEVEQAVTAINSGKPRPCHIPGGEPVVVKTRRIHVEDTENQQDKKAGTVEERTQQLADLFLFCDEPEKKVLGALHFPYARIHVTPEPGKLVVAINRNNAADADDNDDEANELDGYVSEYHLCPNHEVYRHTISKTVTMDQDDSGGYGDGEL